MEKNPAPFPLGAGYSTHKNAPVLSKFEAVRVTKSAGIQSQTAVTVCPIAQNVLDRLAGRHRYGFGFFLRTDLDVPYTGQGDTVAFI